MLGFLLILAILYALWIMYGRGAVIVYKHKKDKGIPLPENADKDFVMDFLKKELPYDGLKTIYFDEDGDICLDGKYNTYYARIIDGRLCIDRFIIEDSKIDSISKKKLAFWIELYGKGIFDRKNAKQVEELECIRAYAIKAFDHNAPINARKKYIDMNKANKGKLAIIALIVVFVAWLAVTVTNSVITSQVTDSTWADYNSNVTIGRAFDEYFDNTKWTWFIKDSNTYVKFSGEFFYDNQRTDATIIFEVDVDRGFRVDDIEIDGKSNIILGAFLIEDVYASYGQ